MKKTTLTSAITAITAATAGILLLAGCSAAAPTPTPLATPQDAVAQLKAAGITCTNEQEGTVQGSVGETIQQLQCEVDAAKQDYFYVSFFGSADNLKKELAATCDYAKKNSVTDFSLVVGDTWAATHGATTAPTNDELKKALGGEIKKLTSYCS